MTRTRSPSRLFSLAAATFALAGLGAGFVAPARAADASTPAKSTYQKERADCEAGRTAEDKATCLREAGAAKVERKRDGLTTDPAARQNAVDRCNALPQKDRADCIARIDGPTKSNQTTTTSGSVAGGGVLRETKTVTPGTVTVIPGKPASSSN